MSNTKNVNKNAEPSTDERIAQASRKLAKSPDLKDRTCPNCGERKTPATTHKLCHTCYTADRKARIELFGVSRISQLKKETEKK